MQQDGQGQPATEPPAGARPAGTTLEVVRDWLGPLDGKTVLDVGCGMGGLARSLAADGANVTGIDPSPVAVEAARAAVPSGRFEIAGAQALPFGEASFEAVVFVNSLHHVPVEHMKTALTEALRVARGGVLIVEPLAEGPFFEVMRPVEDETEIRAAALSAIAGVLGSGDARLAASAEYDDIRRFSGVAAFLEKVLAADPARADAARERAGEVAALYERWGAREGDQMRLDQPHRAMLLRRAGTLS